MTEDQIKEIAEKYAHSIIDPHRKNQNLSDSFLNHLSEVLSETTRDILKEISDRDNVDMDEEYPKTAFLAVDGDNDEWIFENKPYRVSRAGLWNPFVEDENCFCLPKGSIKKLIGRKLTWEDEPVKLKAENNGSKLKL